MGNQLPEVTVALRARDQFLALATSTHPRCGARSPPRALAQPLLRLLWDLCVVATERRLVAAVGASRDPPRHLVHRAGVSPLLLSVTPRGVVHALEEDFAARRADADHYAEMNVRSKADYGFVLKRRDVVSRGCVDVMRLEYIRDPVWSWYGTYYCNRKWWCGLSSERDCMFLQSIAVGLEAPKREGGAPPAPQSVRFGVTVTPENVDYLWMGKSDADELLLVIRPGIVEYGTHEKRILVVDAPQTFTSGILTLVCSVARDLPAGRVREGFILNAKTGELLCVLQVWIQSPRGSSNQIFVVEMNPSGTVKQLGGCKGCELSRVSDSLFCISFDKMQYALWDCNDTDQPLRVVLTAAFVIGLDCGFLLRVTDKGTNKEMCVVDALSVQINSLAQKMELKERQTQVCRTYLRIISATTIDKAMLAMCDLGSCCVNGDGVENVTDGFSKDIRAALSHTDATAKLRMQNMTSVSTSLRSVTCTRRNEMMMDALFELQVGNIDSALSLVANAFSLFASDTINSFNHGESSSPLSSHEGQCEYLPALVFLVCLRCVINDHVSLHHHIPPCLSTAFSSAISSPTEVMSAHCMRVLNRISATEVIAEWAGLASTASSRGNVDHQQRSPHTNSEQSWSCMYFVALWRLYCCSSSTENREGSSSAAHIFVEMSDKMPQPESPCADVHGSKSMITCSVGQIHWCVSSVTSLGLCYDFGVGGVEKDIHKAVTLYQRAADAGSARAMGNLGWCYEHGEGVRKDIHMAVTLYQRAADTGDAHAVYHLGRCYDSGGVEKDTHKAAALYQRAADAGHATAMFNLGSCCYSGDGIDKYVSRAITLWQRAADAGNSDAMCNLGWCYKNGDGVDKDAHKAVTLYQRAADTGSAHGTFALGLCYYKGTGIEKDIHKAVTLFQRAADSGSAQAQCNLGWCYYNGDGVEKDIHQAVALYQRAADAGNSQAMFNLGSCYDYGHGVEKDIHKAVALYQRAADAGCAKAVNRLGECYKNGSGVDKDAHKAVTLWQRAADAGHATAMCYLAECYDNGDGVEKDIHKAVTLWQRAADAGDASAIFNLGVCYQHGDGVEKDTHKAATLWQRAADAGSDQAMYALAQCHQRGIGGSAKDIREAMRLWLAAADLGNLDAMDQLRRLNNNNT
ncbi:chitin synthase regulatory factor chr2 [Pelomyxa schiedti]|nr:chitin synthase regulatory factor chr2 [Pelomyxa schiedti]